MLTANSVDDTMSVKSTVARRLPEVLALVGMAGILALSDGPSMPVSLPTVRPTRYNQNAR
jgi:hypothetical protein